LFLKIIIILTNCKQLKLKAGKWFWGPIYCKIWVTLDVLFSSASIYSLIGISIDRFFAVYKPVQETSELADLKQKNVN
jgi:hypothetical protein